MAQREKLALLVCEATQKTNYKCEFTCENKGRCAYCLIIAEELLAGGAAVQEHTGSDPIEPSPVMLDRQCWSCGVPMGSQDNFCPNCGKRMDKKEA